MNNFSGFTSFLRKNYMVKRTFARKELPITIPQKSKEDKGALLTQLLPLAISAGVMLIFSSLSKNSGMKMGAFYYVFMIGSALTGVIMFFYNRHRKEKNEAEIAENFEKDIAAKYSENTAECSERLKYYLNCFIDDENILLYAVEHLEPYLWNTFEGEHDFLKAQIGISDIPSEIDINFTGSPDSLPDDIKRKVYKLESECTSLKNAPYFIDLTKCPTLGVYGSHRREFVSSMITRLCMRHGYDILRCVLICNNDNYINYQWMRWLPHMWDSSNSDRYIRLSPKRQTYFESLFSAEIDRIEKGFSSPFFVFIIEENDSLFGSSLISYMRKMISMEKAAAIVVSERRNDVPFFCKATVNTDNINQMVFENEKESSGKAFSLDLVSPANLERISRSLSRVKLIDSELVNRIPTKIGFNEMMRIDCSKPNTILNKWNDASSPNDMKCLLGVVTDAAPLYVPIDKAKHMILAGKTGSGKSQFLMSFITYLMVTYPPSFVQFLFIDFKGSALADNFKNVPHCAGTFSNLDGGDDSNIFRIREMLNAQIKEREDLIKKSRAKIQDIKNYNNTSDTLHTGRFLPHLFVVVDEYAELLSQHSEFVEDFERFCRVGRSIGIHLILSSQRLDGKVTDQIKANVDVFVCFKVNSAEESKNVIKCSGAEEFKIQGRAYALAEIDNGKNAVSSNSNDVHEFQAAWVEKPYVPSVFDDDQIIYEVRPDGRRGELNHIEEDQDKTELNVITEALAKLNNSASSKAFSDPLKDTYYWNSGSINAAYAMRGRMKSTCAIIGVCDDFFIHKQTAGIINLTETNFFIAGANKRGKTTALETIVFSSCIINECDRAHFYICELYSQNMMPLTELPQVHSTIIGDSEHFFRLMLYLESEAKRRRNLLGDEYTSLNEYNSVNTENRLSELVVLIDDVDNLIQDYEVAGDRIVSMIANSCMKYGITFIVTATRYVEIRRFIRSFEHFIVLHYNEDAGEELMNAPRTITLKKTPGRCYIENNGRVLQAQLYGFYTPANTTVKTAITSAVQMLLDLLPEDQRKSCVQPVIKRVACPPLSMIPMPENQHIITPIFVENETNNPVYLSTNALNSFIAFGDYDVCCRYVCELVDNMKGKAEIHVIDIAHDLAISSDYDNGLFVYDLSDINLLVVNLTVRNNDIPRVFITHGLTDIKNKLDDKFLPIDETLAGVYNNGYRCNQCWIATDSVFNNFMEGRGNQLNYTRCGKAIVLSPKYLLIGQPLNFGRRPPSLLDIDYNDSYLPNGHAWFCYMNSWKRVVLPLE